MKKVIFTLILALASVASMTAGKGDFAGAVQFSYASKYEQFAIGAQVQYEILNNLRIATVYNHYFENDNVTADNLDLNLHYLIYHTSSVSIYPIAGLAWTNFSTDLPTGGSDDTSKFGANLGCGVEYHITPKVSFFTEEIYQMMSDHNQSVTNMGFKLRF